MIKVFADYIDNHKDFDEQASFSIERVGGIKLLRKYRKAQLINEFIKENKIQGIIGDHWKSLELIQTNKKKILIIGYGSMGKKYENFLKNNYEIYFFDKINKKKNQISNCCKTN